MKVYTKTGDDGTTSLFSGGRVAKDHPRLEAYGTLDELNAILGLLETEPLPAGISDQIRGIQEALFAIGASLADAAHRGSPEAHLTAADLERWIDAMDGELPELKAFILPGGSRGAGLAQLARTVCRRAERRIEALRAAGEDIAPEILPVINRLSDYLFVVARFINHSVGRADPEWRPE